MVNLVKITDDLKNKIQKDLIFWYNDLAFSFKNVFLSKIN